MKLLRASGAALLLLATTGFAQPEQATGKADATPIANELVAAATARKSAKIDGTLVRYRARWAETVLTDASSVPQATISATSYVREDVRNQATRPVLFLFNGGPGASSSPLHFSAFGPRRLGERDAKGNRAFVDNGESLLNVADLVFVDPVGTGFSRELRQGGGKDYWSPSGDAKAVLSLIRDWLRDNQRTGSPVFVAGESYGGYRLATMAKDMKDLNVQGLILISPLLDPGGNGGDLAYIFELPTLAVAAWYHKKRPDDARTVEQVWEDARAFAQGDYVVALQQGSALPAADRDRIAARMAALIGLPADQIAKANLRIDSQIFLETLLPGQIVGRLDVRVTAPKPEKPINPNRPAAANDPALGLGRTNVIKSEPIAAYLRDEIGVRTTRDYYSLTLDVNFNWDWRSPSRLPEKSRDATPNIAGLMQAKPQLRVLLLGGYYDLATPVLGPRYAITHGGVPLDRVDMVTLAAGHSPFEGDANRQRTASVVRHFLTGAK